MTRSGATRAEATSARRWVMLCSGATEKRVSLVMGTLAWRYGRTIVTPYAKPSKLKYSGTLCLRLRRRTACRPRPWTPARLLYCRRWRGNLDPDPHRPPVCLIDLERIGLSDEVAQLAKTERSRVEIGSQVG